MNTDLQIQDVLWSLYKPRANGRKTILIKKILKKNKIKTLRYEDLRDVYNVAVSAKRAYAAEVLSEDPAIPTPAELRFKDKIESKIREAYKRGQVPKLYRQVLVGSYFYDFVVLRRFKRGKSLAAFEINGGIHNTEKKQAKDSVKFDSMTSIVGDGLVMDITNEQVYEDRLSEAVELITDSSILDHRQKIRIWEKIYVSTIAATLNSKAKDLVYAELRDLGYPFSVLSAISKVIESPKTATVAVLKFKEK